MKKQIESLDNWLRTGNWFGQPRAVFVFPALIITVLALLIIIKHL